jgi:chaperonin GroES
MPLTTKPMPKAKAPTYYADDIKPISDLVLIRPSEVEDTFGSSKIVRPDVSKEKQTVGKVLAVGPGKIDESGNLCEMYVTEGDLVAYNFHSGFDIETSDNEMLKLMPINSILAIVKAKE